MRLHAIVILAAVVPTVIVGACSSPSPTPDEPTVENHSAAPPPSQDSNGTLEGKVLYKGLRIPKPTQVENTTDPKFCRKLQSLENVIISPKNKGIRNAIVALKGVPPGPYPQQTTRLILDNRDCRFRPHVAVLTTGSSIEAVNSDPMFHSVHLYGFRNLNLALAPKGSKIVRTVTRPGFIIIKCDIHGWMKAFIRVDRHPFHSVSAPDGSFRIENIPPGSYTLETWHEYFGPKETKVTVKAASVSSVTIYYRSR